VPGQQLALPLRDIDVLEGVRLEFGRASRSLRGDDLLQRVARLTGGDAKLFNSNDAGEQRGDDPPN
jgi:hypothetical protein